LAKEGADFLVIEEGDNADLGGTREGGVGVEQCLDGSPRAKLVIDAASKDEFAVESTSCGGLNIEELEFPVDNGGV
jgi:hypothetical protein